MAVAMNEVSPVETKTITPVAVGYRGLQFDSLEGIWRFSNYVAKSGLAPKGLEKPESILVAIQLGLEIGLQPMQAIQNIAVINGRPCVWGDSAKALCLASPVCEYIIETFEGKESTDDFRAVCEAKRRGYPKASRWEFSIGDAKKADLWNKGSVWPKYGKRMLQMRARAFAIRDAFADVLKGVAIAEEHRDVIEVTAEVTDTPRVKIKTDDDATAVLTEHAPDLAAELRQEIAALAQGMAAETFDAICNEIAPMISVCDMDVDQLAAVKNALTKE